MPELPEVETVRRGLAANLEGCTVVQAEVHHPRTVRHHPAGSADLLGQITGRRMLRVDRRGKYLWIPLDPGGGALLAHLGMSGQFRLTRQRLDEHPHRRFDALVDDGRGDRSWLTFIDQRTFGFIGCDDLVPDPRGGAPVPARWQHVAADPFESGFDPPAVARDIRRRTSEIKRLLLNQTVVSGIGNIYADEALWRARVHPQRTGDRLRTSVIGELLTAAATVMADALEQGGTSFDALYVDVRGESGYFQRALAVYGREGRPCPRCGDPIRRLGFMNRSSFVCRSCQRPPRARR